MRSSGVHRRLLLGLLGRYRERYAEERALVDRFVEFVERRPDCFERSCLEGHVTGSAWIVSGDRRDVLLLHHAKLDRWLQPGGHADGQFDPLAVALREAREESGIEEFEVLPSGADPMPLDIDIHAIPARGEEPEHFHFDVRYLLIAAPNAVFSASEEALDMRWVPSARVPSVSDEESLLRMWRKARVQLQA